MKKTLFLLIALLIAAPAMAAVEITCEHEGSDVVRIDYECTSGEKVRAFALDITVDNSQTIDAITAEFVGECTPSTAGYGIFPGTISIVDGSVSSYGSPVAPGTDPGALGNIPGPGITVEMGSLYEDGVDMEPGSSGTLCRITVSGECAITIAAEDGYRGGVVLEDGSSVAITSPGCAVSYGPSCWDATQCHGDADGSGFIDTSDWPAFRDSFGKTYPDAAYDPCGDFTRDGTVNTSDWPAFRDNFGKSVAADCPTGGTWPPL